MNKQKYKEVTEFAGSHRTVGLKKKQKRKDCTQVCLISKFTGLTMRSFFFLPCWWEEVGFGRRERTVFCSIMFIHILCVPEGFQGPSKETRTQSLLPACGSSPLKFHVFSYKDENSQQPLGWEGQRAWHLSSSIGEVAHFRSFLTVWMPDTWHLGKSRGKSPKAAWDPPVCFFVKQESSLGRRPSETIFQRRFWKTVLLGN